MRILIIILFFSASVILAVDAKIDSLELELRNNPNSDQELLLELANAYTFSNPNKSIEYAEKALALSIKVKDDYSTANALNALGYSNGVLRNFKESFELLDKAKKTSESIDNNKLYLDILLNIGEVFHWQGNSENSINYYKQALSIAKKSKNSQYVNGINKMLGNSYIEFDLDLALFHFNEALKNYRISSSETDIASILNNISNIHSKKGDYVKALEFLQEALKIREKINDEKGLSYVLKNIGVIHVYNKNYETALDYFLRADKLSAKHNLHRLNLQINNSLGATYKNLENYEKAIDHYEKAITLAKQMNHKLLEARLYNNLALLLMKLENFTESEKYYLDAIKISKNNNNKSLEIYLNNIAKLYLDYHQHQKAKKYLFNSLDLAQKNKNDILLEKLYQNLSSFYYQTNNNLLAYKYQQKAYSLNDSINSIETEKHIADLEKKYKTEQKAKEIEILTKNNEINELTIKEQKTNQKILISSIFILIGFSTMFIMFKQRELKTREENEKRVTKINKSLEKKVKEEVSTIMKQQQLLVQKSKLESLGKLASGIAHEINQPLGGISMSLENLYYSFNENDLSEDYFNKKMTAIDGYIDRITNIIEHVRIFSRDQQSSKVERISIDEVIGNTFTLLKTQFKKKNIELIYDNQSKNKKVLGNKYKLEQVLLNFATNSKDSIIEKIETRNLEKGVISLKTFIKNEKLILTFEDNGLGIPEEIRMKIFDPFFTTKDENRGTGLGLSIVYGIIEEMNGEINIYSEIGKYTKFVLAFTIIENEV